MRNAKKSKLVVRKIPVSESDFMEKIAPFASTFRFIRWKNSKVGQSVCWIAFNSDKDLLLFTQSFTEYPIQWSPFQGLPTPAKDDTRMGTIEEDQAYIYFLASQEELFKVDPQRMKEMQEESGLSAAQPKTTPLLDAIREKKERQKREAEKKRDAREVLLRPGEGIVSSEQSEAADQREALADASNIVEILSGTNLRSKLKPEGGWGREEVKGTPKILPKRSE
jgi:Smg-4/UPF3 family